MVHLVRNKECARLDRNPARISLESMLMSLISNHNNLIFHSAAPFVKQATGFSCFSLIISVIIEFIHGLLSAEKSSEVNNSKNVDWR